MTWLLIIVYGLCGLGSFFGRDYLMGGIFALLAGAWLANFGHESQHVATWRQLLAKAFVLAGLILAIVILVRRYT